MPTYRYTLQPYKNKKSRYACPSCNAPNKFTRYIDTETQQHLAGHVGKCDREESCGYHFTPKQYFQDNPNIKPQISRTWALPVQLSKPDFIPRSKFQKSLNHYQKNDFVEYLYSIFDDQTVESLIEDYHIGTAKRWPHATIFWQVDRKDRVRTGKIMLYDPYTGKRIKQPYAHITWVHTLLKEPNYNLQQCLFGEHLIYPGNQKIIAIVESEKTAIIAAGYMPEYVWVAAGSLDALTYEKCRILHGQQVILVPDLDGYAKWEKKMNLLKAKMPGTKFGLANFLRNLPTEQQAKGMDIADWLITTQPTKQIAQTTETQHQEIPDYTEEEELTE